MSPSDKEFRILIVDDQREVARVLRTSLELLDRGYHIVDVPSAEEAILETGKLDMLVADYRLPGMSGLELIERLGKKHSNLKSILITAHDVDELSDKIEKLKVQKVFKKPIETEDFTNAVQDALHGSKAAARDDTLADKIGAIPIIDEGPISLVLSAMRADLGADAVTLVDRKGRIIQQHGGIPEGLRFGELAVLLAGNFTTTGEISTYLGDDTPAAFHFYDGGNHDIYSLALGLHYFLTVVFPAGSERQMGAVVRFGSRAATELMSMVGGEAVKPAVEEKAKEEEKAEAEVKAEPPTADEPEAEEEAVAEAKAEEPEAEQDEEELEPIEVTAPESIDLDALESALKDASDEDADAFWETAAETEASTAKADEALSLEEAIDLGLIPKDLGG